MHFAREIPAIEFQSRATLGESQPVENIYWKKWTALSLLDEWWWPVFDSGWSAPRFFSFLNMETIVNHDTTGTATTDEDDGIIFILSISFWVINYSSRAVLMFFFKHKKIRLQSTTQVMFERMKFHWWLYLSISVNKNYKTVRRKNEKKRI